jgi:uncharacterized membrane protein
MSDNPETGAEKPAKPFDRNTFYSLWGAAIGLVIGLFFGDLVIGLVLGAGLGLLTALTRTATEKQGG